MVGDSYYAFKTLRSKAVWLGNINSFSKVKYLLNQSCSKFCYKKSHSHDDFLTLNETLFIKVLKHDTALCISKRVCRCDDSIHYVPLTNISSYVPNVVLVT